MTINTESLGTPAESYRRQCARRERIFVRVFATGLILCACAASFLAGRNMQIDPLAPSVNQYMIRAGKLAEGKRLCEVEPHEGCLVCMQRLDGLVSVSTHC